MKIKRFVDKDSRSAMARIRAEMGADAVILSSKNVGDQIELVAAVDFDERDLNPLESPKPRLTEPETGPAPDTPTLGDLQRELGNLRGLLEGELAQLAWREMAEKPSVKAALFSRLTKLGLSRWLSGAVVDRLPAKGDLEDIWKKSLTMLSRKIRITGDSLLNDGGVVALVGSTGVGKTTTIAKLAARFVMRHGAKQVGLITTDCYRIGGQEQLETFAGYLGIPMIVATDGFQLKAALDQLSSRKLVLIDTAGMSQRDIRLYEQFNTLKSVGYDIDAYLVLSATAQSGSLKELIQVFGRQALAGAMVTKVDESSSLGGLLDLVIKNNLPLAYVSAGQKVPEDIAPARVEYLMGKAVDLMEAEERSIDRKLDKTPMTSSVAV